jgi:hypothetical protein
MKELLFSLLIFQSIYSQSEKELKVDFSGYLDTYYAYDINQPRAKEKLPFMYNYNRQNEFAINIGLLRAKIEYQNTYASIAFQAGTYVEDNYKNEATKFLNEAFIGVFLDKEKKSTIEIGILPSYIGFESATTASNLNVTRSILAENSPYFMTGLKYGYKPNDRWNFAFFVTNGWQRIQKAKTDIPPSFGSQIQYRPSESSLLNWSTFAGVETYSNHNGLHLFSNFYWDKTWNKKWRTISGFDIGTQNRDAINESNGNWMSLAVITQYIISSKWQLANRIEYYKDKKNVIITTSLPFEAYGTSLNLDYIINSKVKYRMEARYMKSDDTIFPRTNDLTDSTLFFTSSLSFEF